MVDIGESRSFKTRADWRSWLEKNHRAKKELWVIFFRKGSGKKSVRLDEAVEEALCFGWIDSIMKRLDEERYVLRFTPRKKGSVWSEVNLRRVEKMKKEGKMAKAGIDAAKWAKLNPLQSIMKKDLKVPDYIEKELMQDKAAWKFFSSLSTSHKRQYVWWIASAKMEETRQRRIAQAIDHLRHGRKPGMNGFQ